MEVSSVMLVRVWIVLVKPDSVTTFTYVLPARRIFRSKTLLLVTKLKILEM